MNNHPEDDSTELKPGDVIYINESKPKPVPPKPPEPVEPVEKSEPAVVKPPPRPKPPTFDIPPAEEKKPVPENRPPAEPKPKPPAFDIPPAEKKVLPPDESGEAEVIEDDEEPEPVTTEADDLPPESPVTDEPPEPSRPAPPRPKLQPLGNLPADGGVIADRGPQLQPPAPPNSTPPRPEVLPSPPNPPLAPALPPVQPVAPPPASPATLANPPHPFLQAPNPPAPPPARPANLQPGQDFSFISPQAAMAPPPATPVSQEALKAPVPAEGALPLPAWPPVPPTDLGGGLTADPILPAPAQPLPPVLPTPTAEEAAEEVAVPEGEKSTRGLKIFGAVTLFIIAATVTLGGFFLWPMLRQALESDNEKREFEHMLVNLLQVENQEIEIKLTECRSGSECSQLGNIVPDLPNQDAVSAGRVSVSGNLKIEYSAETAAPAVSSTYEFDLSLSFDDAQQDNLILDIAAVFPDGGGAYFKLDDLSIDGQAVDLEDTSFGGRWSDLEALLRAGRGGETAVLEENESVFLNYIANLLDLYSYSHYAPLLPIFNISESQDYHQAADILTTSGAYELHSNKCRSESDAELTCRMTIDYDKLYTAYEDIYDVLDQSMPAYYGILRAAGDPGNNLPEVVDITFDKERDYPVSISVPQSASEISATSWLVNYKSFDESAFEVRSARDPLGLAEYHEQILDYEQDIDFR